VIRLLPNAHTPPPYPLPRHAAKTVLRTRSTPHGHGYNEISFDDKLGDELVYQRAERDRETLVQREERERVEGSRRRMVGGDEHVAIGGERRDQVRGDEHRSIGGMFRAEVGGGASLVVAGDVHLAITGRLALDVGGGVHIRSGESVVIEGVDATVRGAGGFVRATGGGVVADGGPVLINKGGAPGVGAGSSPESPSPPVLPAAYRAPLPAAIHRLPVLGAGPVPWTAMNEEEIICEAICVCKALADEQAADGERRKAQICVTQRLRAYDRALNGKSTIKAEVPYDMSQTPPTPIMSRNEPERPTFGRPKGSNIPDVVVVKDPEKPPTQDNIDKVIEIKFPPDKLTPDQAP
jgi:type VI secretion system secreted protein VgrG